MWAARLRRERELLSVLTNICNQIGAVSEKLDRLIEMERNTMSSVQDLKAAFEDYKSAVDSYISTVDEKLSMAGNQDEVDIAALQSEIGQAKADLVAKRNAASAAVQTVSDPKVVSVASSSSDDTAPASGTSGSPAPDQSNAPPEKQGGGSSDNAVSGAGAGPVSDTDVNQGGS